MIFRSSPLRLNTGSGRTWTVTNRSPAGLPLGPASPLPASRTFCPLSSPGGIRTVMVRVRCTVPVPVQSEQGSVITCPVPLQCTQGAENPNAPWFSEVNPVPLQYRQAVGFPVLDPEPWQVVQGALPVSCMGSVVPWVASRKSSVISASTSAPLVGRAVLRGVPPPPPPRLKSPPKISLKLLPSDENPPRPPPKRSLTSKSVACRNPPPKPVLLPPKPPLPNPGMPPEAMRSLSSSYSLRFLSSPRTSYASATFLKRSSAALSPGCLSGWLSRASLR